MNGFAPWIALLALAAGEPPLQEPKRAPVPDPAAQAEAKKLIREVFKEEYTQSTLEGRKALAKKLLEQALKTNDDLVTRHVLFQEARSLAADSADLDTVLKAIEALASLYEEDVLDLKEKALSTVALGARTGPEMKAVGRELLKLADESMEAENLERAQRGVAQAATLSRRAKDEGLAEEVGAKEKEVNHLKATLMRVTSARVALSKDARDPQANLIVGRYLCFTKGDWDGGLPHLAKGPEGAIKSAALRDLSTPQDAAGRIGAGDGWWEVAEKESGDERSRVAKRAASWYHRALPDATGLHKVKIEKRLADLGRREHPQGPAGDQPREKEKFFVGEWVKIGTGSEYILHPDGRIEKTFNRGSGPNRYTRGRWTVENELIVVLFEDGDGQKLVFSVTGPDQIEAKFLDGVWKMRKKQ